MVTPAAAIYVLMLVVPAGFAVYYSFTKWNGMTSPNQPGPAWVGLANYKLLFTSEAMRETLLTTGLIAGVGALLVNVAALGLAVLLQRNTRMNVFGRVVAFYPHVLAVLVVGYLWQALLGPQGAVNNVISKLGAAPLPFLSDPRWALWTMIFVIIWGLLGVQMVLYLAGLQAIPSELLEAARIDGANRWQVFRSVTWPGLAPSATVAMITSLITLLKTYDIVVSFTGGGPGGATRTLAYNVLFTEFTENRRVGQACAQAVLLMVVAAALSFTVMRLRRRAEEGAESVG